MSSVKSDKPCPKCGAHEWWLKTYLQGKSDDALNIISRCNSCGTFFTREVKLVQLDSHFKIVKSDEEIAQSVVSAKPETADIAAIFLQKNWKSLDSKIVRVDKTRTGYKMWAATGSGWDVPSMLLVHIAKFMSKYDGCKTTAEIKALCTNYSPYTVDHALRLMKHIGLLHSNRRGIYSWSFMKN